MASFQPDPHVTETDLGGGSFSYESVADGVDGDADRWYFYEITRPDGTVQQSGWARGSGTATGTFAIPGDPRWQEDNRRASRKGEKLKIVLYSSGGRKGNQNRNEWTKEATDTAVVR